MLWGEKDPWENIDLGRKLFADIPSVKVRQKGWLSFTFDLGFAPVTKG